MNVELGYATKVFSFQGLWWEIMIAKVEGCSQTWTMQSPLYCNSSLSISHGHQVDTSDAVVFYFCFKDSKIIVL